MAKFRKNKNWNSFKLPGLSNLMMEKFSFSLSNLDSKTCASFNQRSTEFERIKIFGNSVPFTIFSNSYFQIFTLKFQIFQLPPPDLNFSFRKHSKRFYRIGEVLHRFLRFLKPNFSGQPKTPYFKDFETWRNLKSRDFWTWSTKL